MMKHVFTLFLSIVLFSCAEKNKPSKVTPSSSPVVDSLNLALNKFQLEEVLPGFSVSIFSKDSILYQNGFGYRDIEQKTPYNVNTQQIIASITKTFVGVAVMKSVEEGKLKLDDNINDYIDFEVINPHYPEEPITIRHLATHTSTITGTTKSDKGYRFEKPLNTDEFPQEYSQRTDLISQYNKTGPLTMPNFLKKKLSTDGNWYESELFVSAKPGTEYHYSNLGITLLAHIVEKVQNKPFDEYTTETILKPLEMNSSTWSFDEIDSENHISYYNEIYNQLPKYYIISYPDGGLYSTVEDLTKFVQEIMACLHGEGILLSKESTKKMLSKQLEGDELTEGICWDLSFEGLAGHAGNDFGTSTLMYFNPETKIGRILFTNITTEEKQEETFYGIFNTLFQYEF